jgi:alkane 1-monooxygenase
VWTTVVYAVVVSGLVAVGTAAALQVLVFWLVQAAVAVWLLEAVNYIEHYGLVRAEVGGQREAFGMHHAWNADHVMANSLLANLQRHSDHHMHAWKPWTTLEALPGPQLPGSYTVCVTMAAVPAWWFASMHPRLNALQTTTIQPEPK